jgi:mannitol-1-phosphate 5-dehydrogenase
VNGLSTAGRTYVGFGFGAIQAGLFLYEAFRSGAFRRLTAVEVAADLVARVRRNGGFYSLNIAHSDRVECVSVGPVEIEDPVSEPDRRRIIDAVSEAEEIGTAVPSVLHYTSDGPGSPHRLLAEGLRRKAARNLPRAVVYAAENHNHAAEILEKAVLAAVPEGERRAVRSRVRFLNTVIGKMSGVIAEPAEPGEPEPDRVTPYDSRAFLVEAFNRILISGIRFEEVPGEPPYRRGIRVFEEKEDLLPFEEAKLYGHNATHALAAYLALFRGIRRIAALAELPGAVPFLRNAFLEESGESLIRKHRGADPLFTREGYREYADDLLRRMTNPHLRDTAERVGRDPRRKLGWNDRLVGTIRLALAQGVRPVRYSMGAAAALAVLHPEILSGAAGDLKRFLSPLWRDCRPRPNEEDEVVSWIEGGLRRIRQPGFLDDDRQLGNPSSS